MIFLVLSKSMRFALLLHTCAQVLRVKSGGVRRTRGACACACACDYLKFLSDVDDEVPTEKIRRATSCSTGH